MNFSNPNLIYGIVYCEVSRERMPAESRPDLNLAEQVSLALRLVNESEERLSLMEETLRCITGTARVVGEARRERQGKVADMKERILSIRGNINRRRQEAATKEDPQTDGPLT